MLRSHQRRFLHDWGDGEFAELPAFGLADADRFFSALRRQRRAIVLGWLVGALLGCIYAFGTPHSYTATAQILVAIDDQPLRFGQNAKSRTLSGADVSFVDTQVEVLKSERIANSVIKRLNLDTDSNFLAGPTGVVQSVRSYVAALLKSIGLNEKKDAANGPQRRAAKLLADNLEIERAGHTAVIQLGFTWPDADRAVAIANAFASAFLDDQVRHARDFYQSVANPETRVIAEAWPPEAPRRPKRALIFLLAAALGAVVGAGFGALREFLDRTFRTSAQLEKETSLECIGMLPLIKQRQLPNQGLDLYLLQQPRSNFAENLRRIKLGLDTALPNEAARVIGIVSAMHGEGRTTVSRNLALLLARLGARTALIEADIKERGGNDTFLAAAQLDLLDIFTLDIAGMGLSDLLSSTAFLTGLKTLQEKCQYILLDLPPLGPVVGVQALAPHIGGFMLVIEWGKTSIDSVYACLHCDLLCREKVYWRDIQ